MNQVSRKEVEVMNAEYEIRLARIEMAMNKMDCKSRFSTVIRGLVFAVYVAALVAAAWWFVRHELDKRSMRPVVQEMVSLKGGES